MKTEGRVTPWYSWEEWQYVKKLLFSFGDVTAQQKGVGIIEMWKSNVRHGTLPISIELTSSLVTVHLQNEKLSENLEYLKLASAMVLVRFINGITDQLQTGEYAQSVQIIAEKLNIPDWLVDLRHESTHSVMPGFDVLKSGILFSLNWLEQNYWIDTENKLIEYRKETYKLIKTKIIEYKNVIEELMKLKQKESKDKELKQTLKNKESFCKDLTQSLLKSCNRSDMDMLVNILMEDGGFVIDTVQNCFEVKLFNTDKALTENEIKELESLAKLWKPFFISLHLKFSNFADCLIQKLIKCFSPGETQSNLQVAVLFCIFILNHLKICNKQSVITFLIENPSTLAFQILNIIIMENEYPDDFRDLWNSLYIIFRKTIDFYHSDTEVLDFNKLDMILIDSKQRDVYNLLINQFNDTKSSSKKAFEPLEEKWKLLSKQQLLDLHPIGFDDSADYLTGDKILENMEEYDEVEHSNKSLNNNVLDFLFTQNEEQCMNDHCNERNIPTKVNIDFHVGGDEEVESNCGSMSTGIKSSDITCF